jgi:DNA-binding CsgD family transcriptional regulator
VATDRSTRLKARTDVHLLRQPRRVGIIHEHDVLRRGVADCLREDQALEIAFTVAEGSPRDPADVAVVSRAALLANTFDCAIVVFDVDVECLPRAETARVVALLPVGHVTAEQLVASVRAAAVGLTVDLRKLGREPTPRLDERRIAVLQMLASGETTRTISSKLSYSERTIKSLIRDVEYELSASNRAQAVAEAIRLGLI